MIMPSESTTSPKLRFAYIGMGLMGGPMLRRLISLGYRMRAHDLDATRLSAAAAAGAEAAESAAWAAAAADFVLLNLPSAQAIERVLFGSRGAAEAMSAASLVIDFSTIPAPLWRDFAARLRERTGAAWIDAPVSGGPVAAAEGQLTVMGGGSTEDFARRGAVLRQHPNPHDPKR